MKIGKIAIVPTWSPGDGVEQHFAQPHECAAPARVSMYQNNQNLVTGGAPYLILLVDGLEGLDNIVQSVSDPMLNDPFMVCSHFLLGEDRDFYQLGIKSI